MALDRFVYWNKEKPSHDTVRRILEDFLGGIGEIAESLTKEKGKWWIVTLPGVPSHPFKSLHSNLSQPNLYPDGRWFEVCYISDDNCDVITRQADCFTNNVAQGFAVALATYFKARLEDGVQNKDYSK